MGAGEEVGGAPAFGAGPSARVWLASYPPGVPAEVDPDVLPSLAALVEESARRFRTRPAYSSLGGTLSFGELEEASRRFAAFLQAELGFAKGERLAIMLPNVLAYPVALFGALRAGLVVVNVNPLFTPREIEEQLADSGAAGIVALDAFAHRVAEVHGRVPLRALITARLGDLLPFPRSALVNFVARHVKGMAPAHGVQGTIAFGRALALGARQRFQPVALGPEDLAFLQYTGGTTGGPKAAMLTHRNLVANIEQCTALLAPVLEPGEEVIVTALPLYHIFALTANALVFLRLGGRNHLVANARDLPGLVAELGKVPFTAITGVNTLFNKLLDTPGFSELDFSRLKLALGGGMAVQRPVAERWQAVTGMPLVEGYGLTETSPVVCINPPGLGTFTGSIGLPVPSTECCVRDDDGRMLAAGAEGELCVRGPQVMRGYWGREAETRRVLSADGWLRTGDLAVMDERGFFRVVDRKKDLILVSGFNVYPNEVEAVLAAHPAVLEAGVIGVPDGVAGEAVKAVVVTREPAPGAEALRRHCREQLAAYKIPKYVEFTHELPKSNVGKILRRRLRELYGHADWV